MIDTHQHLLYPDRFTYDWTADFPALHGAFTLEDYRKAAAGCGIKDTVFMEVDVAEQQSADEARLFCSLADEADSGILGVIAAASPESDRFEHHLDAIAHPRLKGLRRGFDIGHARFPASPREQKELAEVSERIACLLSACELEDPVPTCRIPHTGKTPYVPQSPSANPLARDQIQKIVREVMRTLK